MRSNARRGSAKSRPGRAFDILLALVDRRERAVGKSELIELIPGPTWWSGEFARRMAQLG